MKLQFNSSHKFLTLQVFLGLVFLALLALSVFWPSCQVYCDDDESSFKTNSFVLLLGRVSKHQFSIAKRPFSQFALANFNQAYFGPIVNGFWLVKCIVMMMKVPKTKSLLLLLRCQRANLFHEILCMFPNLNLIAKLVGEKTAFLKVITVLKFQAVWSKGNVESCRQLKSVDWAQLLLLF